MILKKWLKVATAFSLTLISTKSLLFVKAEDLQPYDAEVSAANSLNLLDKYDPDGSYIVSDGIKNGDDISAWLSQKGSNAKSLDTVVHEECHSFTSNNIGGNGETIYTGNKQYINVYRTDTFPTQEWADTISDDLKTFRYDTYVSKNANQYMDSNMNGVYGLLNEFNAYSWGMNDQIKLFRYYKECASSGNDAPWFDFINSCENDYMAFCEFRWWTLEYLDYAEKNHQYVYSRIMFNQDYINAYCTTERRFEYLIAQYKYLRNDSGFTFDGKYAWSPSRTGIGMFSEDQKKLLNQIEQNDLQKQENLLFAKRSVDVLPAQNLDPYESSIPYDDKKEEQVEKIILSDTERSVYPGDEFNLRATIYPADASHSIKWSSSDENVALIDPDGHVIAKKPGRTKIKAEISSVFAECT